MVAGFQDELDSEDEAKLTNKKSHPVSSTAKDDVVLSSEDEDDKPQMVPIPVDISSEEDVAESVLPSHKHKKKAEQKAKSNSHNSAVTVTEAADDSVSDSSEEDAKNSTVAPSNTNSLPSLSNDRDTSESDVKDNERDTSTPEADRVNRSEKGAAPFVPIEVPQEDLSNWLDQFEQKVLIAFYFLLLFLFFLFFFAWILH